MAVMSYVCISMALHVPASCSRFFFQSISSTCCPKVLSMYKQALFAYVMVERVQRVAVGKSLFAVEAVSSELSYWHAHCRLSCRVVSCS